MNLQHAIELFVTTAWIRWCLATVWCHILCIYKMKIYK